MDGWTGWHRAYYCRSHISKPGGATSLKMLNNLPGWEFCLIHDCEAEADNPVESKCVVGSAADPKGIQTARD